MARPVNQIAKFRASIAQNIDYLGGIGFCRPELEKVDGNGQPVYDITPRK